MRMKRSLLLAALGAAAYPLMEMAWRGRTAPSMAAAGGTAVLLLDGINRTMRRRPLWQRSLAGGAAITALEYVLGRTVNRRRQIWDYSGLPLHVNGQICPQYAAMWCLLSLPALAALNRIKR